MTQYDDRVQKQKELIAAEEWGRQVKYLHAHNGILEVAFNNGLKQFEETATGKKWTEGDVETKESLLRSFGRYMADFRGK
jgi:hypothetical protein